MTERSTPDECAVCGAVIPAGALACPECGADERTGWREQDVYDGLDLPDGDSETRARSSGPGILWKLTGLALLVIAVVLVFRGWW